MLRICLLLIPGILQIFADAAPLRRSGHVNRAASAQQPSSADVVAAAAAQAAAAAAKRSKIKVQSANSTAALRVNDVHLKLGREDDWHPFEGIGALSAGASSRLLLDYPEEQRSEILDLLFKPKYGASLQVLKVEIGGDMQSTDGSEPSHMHFKGEEPDCSRGYETWLMKEAKARNPAIRIYALAWGVPGWIGNGTYFSQDNIVYHISWLKCVREKYGFDVEYIGIWNEMPWGQVWYVEELARTIAAEKLKTRLVLLDAVHGVDQGFIDLFTANATFRSLVDAVGMHYPCNGDDKLMKALSLRKQTRFWASEELSTAADWGGAGCWGRMLNQNYIRMNATSSIAWSLVWSAYPNLECFGNGLLYAFEPWSGHFGVMPPVWTSAHTTQFTEAGWHYLATGDGAGLLPEGGTFVTMVSGDVDDFTIVLETLQGQCFYRGGCFHDREANAPQKIRFQLGQSEAGSSLAAIARKRGGALEVWSTNKTHLFERQADAHVDADGSVTLMIPVDAMLTVSTLRGASKQGYRSFGAKVQAKTMSAVLVDAGTPDAFGGLPGNRDKPVAPFPFPYSEAFDEYVAGRMPKFFADQGGAFEVVEDAMPGAKQEVDESMSPKGALPLQPFHVNKVLEQRVVQPPIAWIGKSPEPLTLLGDVNWTDISAEVTARMGPPQNLSAKASKSRATARNDPGAAAPVSRHVGLCVRLSRYHFFGSGAPEGYCLRLVDSSIPSWILLAAGTQLATGRLSPEAARRAVDDSWLHLRLEMRGARLQAFIEGEEVANLIDTMLPFGQAALECGYHRCQFDDLKLSPLMRLEAAGIEGATRFMASAGARAASQRTLVRRVDITQFLYNDRSCDPAPRMAPRRSDFTGLVGFAFEPIRPLLVKGLGRLRVSGGHPWARVHNVSLYEENAAYPIASVALPADATSQVGIEETDDGWVFAYFREALRLKAGTTYLLTSSELANVDTFYDKGVHVNTDDDIRVKGPVYLDTAGWHKFKEANKVYGPLNALLEAAPVSPLLPFGKAQGSALNASQSFGQAHFTIGQKVQRRDKDKDWDTGFVTSIDPLLVTVQDDASASGYRWDEVRKTPEVAAETAKTSLPSIPGAHSFRAAAKHREALDTATVAARRRKRKRKSVASNSDEIERSSAVLVRVPLFKLIALVAVAVFVTA